MNFGGISHGKLHQAENQPLHGEDQLPTRRGRLGLIIPSLTLIGAAVAALVIWLTS